MHVLESGVKKRCFRISNLGKNGWILTNCMSDKSCPFSYRDPVYKKGQDFLYIQCHRPDYNTFLLLIFTIEIVFYESKYVKKFPTSYYFKKSPMATNFPGPGFGTDPLPTNGQIRIRERKKYFQ